MTTDFVRIALIGSTSIYMFGKKKENKASHAPTQEDLSAKVVKEDALEGVQFYVLPDRYLELARTGELSKASPNPEPVSIAPLPEEKIVPAPAPVPIVTPATDAVAPPPVPPVQLDQPTTSPIRKALIIWGIIGGLVVVGGGIAAFFVVRSLEAPPSPPVVVVPPPVPPAPPAPPPPPVIEPEAEPEPLPNEDLDGDGLTNVEEDMLGTDRNRSDSDADFYNDALELANLYNPAGIAPERLIDAGLVNEYIADDGAWSIYLPFGWRPVVDTIDNAVSILVEGGEMLIAPRSKPGGTDFEDWVQGTYGEERVLAGVVNKRGSRVVRARGDSASAWVEVSDVLVLELSYLGDDLTYFPNFFSMMIESARSGSEE
jgi:hypothetical protein